MVVLAASTGPCAAGQCQSRTRLGHAAHCHARGQEGEPLFRVAAGSEGLVLGREGTLDAVRGLHLVLLVVVLGNALDQVQNATHDVVLRGGLAAAGVWTRDEPPSGGRRARSTHLAPHLHCHIAGHVIKQQREHVAKRQQDVLCRCGCIRRNAGRPRGKRGQARTSADAAHTSTKRKTMRRCDMGCPSRMVDVKQMRPRLVIMESCVINSRMRALVRQSTGRRSGPQ